MPRIALLQRFLPPRSPGGVGHFTDGLANALAARGHDVTVFSADPAAPDARYDVVRIGERSGAAAPIAFPFWAARVDYRDFDVLHAQGDDQWIPPTRRPATVRTLHGSSLLEAVHNGVRLGSPRRALLHLYFYAWELLAVLRADAVAAVSAHTAQFYPRVDRVIPNGIDLDRYSGRIATKSAVPSVLFVGDLDSRKRGRWLLDVFREQVRRQIPTCELWLVGADDVRDEGIRAFGRVDRDRLVDLYRQAWVMCLPSSYEGFGRPYAEAMAAGTAVVATPNPGAREVLVDGQFGVMAGDDELGAALCRVLGDRELRDEYGRRGLGRAREYAWDRVAAQYEALYDTALARRG